MTVNAGQTRAVVSPTTSATSRLRPLGGGDVTVARGFWAERMSVNRERTLAHGFAEMERAGYLANLRLAAGAPGRYTSLSQALGLDYPFLDSDLYKWLEAVGWELGHGSDAALERMAGEAIDLIAAAQRGDGYVNSFVQVVAGGNAYRDLAWGHELYCLGHLIQAGIAWHRALADDRLLGVAIRAADHAEREFGAGGRDGVDGHPEIELALVELLRATGERRYLDLAARMIDLRGRGLLGEGRFGAAYWQDHAPVREQTSVTGHAVRQLYLDCGAVDVAAELGDDALLDAVLRRWRDMVASRTYLTGGVGSRHRDESFGDPYELSPDRAYAETCGAIASVMLAWRLLLATGDAECADVIERALFNGMLPGVSLDGTRFFYVNTLQRRTRRAASGSGAGSQHGARVPWFACACCPPNLMRTLSALPQYLATADDEGIQVHQYASGELTGEVAGERVRLAVETEYPWDGRITVSVEESPAGTWTLTLRVPGWCRSATFQVGSQDATNVARGEQTVAVSREWRAGDRAVLTLDMPPRVTNPHPRVDAVRGCVALERGPLVYCIETADLSAGVELEDVELDSIGAPASVRRSDIGNGIVGLAVPAFDARTGSSIELSAIPYYAWANRSVEAMRVWIPRR